ncbi:MAG: extracellular solute-binding protein [Leptolyngbyaceae bacterium]|nr:extracellular solute-binding protein [Leptolyngbyaceae bacterium]
MKQRPFPYRRGRSHHLNATRRRFLQGSAAAVGTVLLSNCRPSVTDVQSGAESTPSASGAGSDALHVYTWSGYTDEDMTRQFTEETGIEVVVDLYDSNESMLARMQAGGGDAYSVIYPSEYMVQEMMDLDLLLEMDQSKFQSLDGIFFDQWQDPAYDPGNAHSIPYSWGTTGLLYNTSLVTPPLDDWNYLWEYSEQLDKRMILLDDVRETMGAVLKSLGYSINSTNPEEIEQAYQRLLELKPYLANFQSFGYEDQILGGDLWIAMSYSSEAIPVTLEDDSLAYVVPSSGATLWTDTIVIPKSAPNVEAAYQWIDYLLRPEVAKRAVENLFFATPLKSAYDILSDELKQNENLFPPEAVLAKCESLAPVDEATELYEQYWTEITS